MSRYYLDFPELVEAKKADLLKLKEDKIDKLIQEIQNNKQHQTSFSDFKHETISSKSVYGYVTKSAKQLFSLLNSNSKVKKSKSPDSQYLQAIVENQKILASLIIQMKLNNQQLNEMIENDE